MKWPEAGELARLLVAMGEFMDEGHTYEETYAHAIQITTSEPIKRLFQEMLDAANKSHGSPLELMSRCTELVPRWLFFILLAGSSAGVPTIWIKGGKALLKVWQHVIQAPGAQEVPQEVQGNAFMLLYLTATNCGVSPDDACRSSAEFLDLKALENFFQTVSKKSSDSSSPIADTAKQFPQYFSSDLIDEIASAEGASDPFVSFNALAKKLCEA